MGESVRIGAQAQKNLAVYEADFGGEAGKIDTASVLGGEYRPIMAPLSDVIGVTRQMAVMMVQFGDGFTNLFTPPSVNLMSCLAVANLSLKRWYKFLIPCYAMLLVVMVVSIFVGTAIGFH